MVKWGSWNKSKDTTEVRKTAKRRDTYGKGRSSRTNQNKIHQLTKFFNGLFKRSQELKLSKKYPNKTKYFCNRYPTLESYLKTISLKQVSDKR